jgi:Sulfotransferase family
MSETSDQSNFASQRRILAFVHIEKAAGTTIVEILRRNFCMRLCEVRPLTNTFDTAFSAEDMRRTLMINPTLLAITGHAVKPYSNVRDAYPNVQYVTLLRDPVHRYVSHYQYWVERMGKTIAFEEFLNLDKMQNFQTRKITGGNDLALAKEILNSQFMLVGLVEQFDEFVLLLREKLLPYRLDPLYRVANATRTKTFGESILKQFSKEIAKNNELDIELYNYVKHALLPGAISAYGDGFKEDLARFREFRLRHTPSQMRRYLYQVYKKLYFVPVSGAVRLTTGLPFKGSYGIRT